MRRPRRTWGGCLDPGLLAPSRLWPRIDADPVAVVEVAAGRFDLNEAERTSVLTHLIRGGDLSQWGLANAVTRAAQDSESFDRATELEAAGGRVIELAPSDWKALAA